MATLHVRRLPEPLYHRLTKLADQEHRSLSAEVRVLLERELRRTFSPAAKALKALDRSRFRPSRGVPPTLELLRADRRR